MKAIVCRWVAHLSLSVIHRLIASCIVFGGIVGMANAADDTINIQLRSPNLAPIMGTPLYKIPNESGCTGNPVMPDEGSLITCFLSHRNPVCAQYLTPASDWITTEMYAGVWKQQEKTYSYSVEIPETAFGVLIACHTPTHSSPVTFQVNRTGVCHHNGNTDGYSGGSATDACINDATTTIVGSPNSCAKGPNALVGDPCDAATGDVTETQVDYSSPVLQFARTYHSIMQFGSAGLGIGWTHSFSSHLTLGVSPVKPQAWLSPTGYVEPLAETASGSGIFISVTGSGNQVRASGANWILYRSSGERETYNSAGQLTSIENAAGQITSLSYSDGLLSEVEGPFGHKLVFSYDAHKRYIERITDPAGHDISYGYDDDSLNLETVTYQDTEQRVYLYDDTAFPHHLTGIKDENGVQYVEYEYDDDGRVIMNQLAGGIGHIDIDYGTGVGQTVVTDAASHSTTYTFSGKANQWQWRVGSGSTIYTSMKAAIAAARDISDDRWNLQAIGDPVSYTAPTSGGSRFRKVTAVSLDSAGPSYTYYSGDDARRVDQITDERNHVTKHAYDTFHLIARTEAYGESGFARTISYDGFLEDTSELPTMVTTPSVKGGGDTKLVDTSYVSTSVRVPDVITIQGYDPISDDLLTRTTTFANFNNHGQPETIDGPRDDVTDTIDITYWDESSPGVSCATTAGGGCGQVASITDALDYQTTFDEYYEDGRLKQVTDPNNRVTVYTYDLRGRLNTVTETPASGTPRATDYDYDDAGQLKKVTLANGQILNYAWTSAHLLDYVTDNAGNKIDYSYDSRGNRTGEDLKNSSGSLRKALALAYDTRNRLESRQEGSRPAAEVHFDAAGLREDETDSGGHFTDYQYDPLNRLWKVIDAVNGSTDPTVYGYDVHDNQISMATPNGATTTYVYDDLGNLRKEVSADRGTTLYGYDAAGNMTCKADGRFSGATAVCEDVGNRWTYGYDALNRVTSIDYHSTGTGADIAFEWDTRSGATTQIGRLRLVTYVQDDITVTRKMDYDAWGNMTWSQQVVDDGTTAKTFTTELHYDGNNQIDQITYPSGRVVDYTRSANGRITGISATFRGDTAPVVSDVDNSFTPFGPPRIFTYGNGLQRAITIDTAYAPDGLVLWDPSTWDIYADLGYTLDDAGNIVAIDDWIDTAKSRSYGYDDLNRMTWDSGISASSPSYTYDGNGNRLTRDATVSSSADQTFVYETASNRISTSSTNGGTALNVDYDGMGNVTDSGIGLSYNYDDGGRLGNVYQTSTTTGLGMIYNGLGELARTRKTSADACTSEEVLLALEYFSFLPDGRSLELVSANNSRVETDWVWLDDQPVAQFDDSYDASGTYQGTTVTYLMTDHLGTPRIGTNESAQVTWRLDTDAFGNGPPSGSAVVRLRLPGQIDLSLGLTSYNYYRDYFSWWGRYLESDPIGLAGGANSYAYLKDSPLMGSDPFGLDSAGNLTSGRTDQDLRCSSIASPLNASDCAKRCCVAHDLCYEAFGCNYSSWFYPFTAAFRLSGTRPCTVCNTAAAFCVTTSMVRSLSGSDCSVQNGCAQGKLWTKTANWISNLH